MPHHWFEGLAERFVWPQVQGGIMRMSSAQFAALFGGVDWRLVRARRPLAAG